jgi:hypothetical protein
VALPNTTTLDIAARGLPSEFVIHLTSGPNIATGLLDTASRGLPVLVIRALAAATVTARTQVVWVGG